MAVLLKTKHQTAKQILILLCCGLLRFVWGFPMTGEPSWIFLPTQWHNQKLTSSSSSSVAENSEMELVQRVVNDHDVCQINKSTVVERQPKRRAALLSSLTLQIVICLARVFTAKVTSGRAVRHNRISFITRRAATGRSWPLTVSSSGSNDPSSKWGVGVGATVMDFPLNFWYNERH